MTIKILLIGNSSVGKTSIIKRLDGKDFCTYYLTTIGIDYIHKNIDLYGKQEILQIWDTAGQERFRTITKSYYRGAHGIAFIFDLTNKKSFDEITYWIKSSQCEKRENNNLKYILIGTKLDLSNDRVVDKQEAICFALNHDMKYFEISSKTFSNYEIDRCFIELAKMIPKNTKVNKVNSMINLNKKKIKYFSKCCSF